MSSRGHKKNRRARHAVQRVAKVARRGQVRLNEYRQQAATLGTWLRSHLFRQVGKGQQTKAGRSLRNVLAARRLRERQQVYRNGGGRSSTATYARERASEAVRRKRR